MKIPQNPRFHNFVHKNEQKLNAFHNFVQFKVMKTHLISMNLEHCPPHMLSRMQKNHSEGSGFEHSGIQTFEHFRHRLTFRQNH